MSEKTPNSPPAESTPPLEPSLPPPSTSVELSEGVRKGTQVMPELSVPQDVDPPSAAPIAAAPTSDSSSAEPTGSSDGSGGSSSSEK